MDWNYWIGQTTDLYQLFEYLKTADEILDEAGVPATQTYINDLVRGKDITNDEAILITKILVEKRNLL